ncbi:phosphoribosyl-AMP cyclohydrolase [Fulvimarina sp. MAC8]|uniref:phosphoribosyl-AMP cyclohydrolase n=1 Tax=Fulvimarina sp. MAC8 TaxID=3162874 RepID=UPI0032EBBB66
MAAIFADPAEAREQEEGLTLRPRFDANGLVTAVVTDHESGRPMMVAHMNAEALDKTIETGIAHYWSRSRQTLWKKGETSGALQSVHAVHVDCDQDAVWLSVTSAKPEDTCHTGRPSCFYRKLDLQSRKLVPSIS